MTLIVRAFGNDENEEIEAPEDRLIAHAFDARHKASKCKTSNTCSDIQN